ncbi:protein kinase [Bacteroides sp. AN502(2024)]|uniref:serine/threonine-protein kinase n=1 Tax=Bacteroides sp. AN502(2024) TaxID=3160599 RepID=UPI00351708B0
MQQLPINVLLQGGKYKIEKVLGQGGFGITYLASQELLDRKVCIKEFFYKEYCERDEATSHVTLGTQSNREVVERFMTKFIKEARTISQLNHPHIIRIHDIFKENNTAYYVMEYIEGESLAERVNRDGMLSEAEAVDYIRQVADALSYIHGKNLLHLDIKPGNIMVDCSGHVILIDFGLSKQYDFGGDQTSTTPVGISHGYAPMEQYNVGGVSNFSPQTDIYSLGATLYKLVTGDTPPQASDVLNEGLPALPPRLSDGVKNAIECAMQVKKKDRPRDVDAFVSLLDVHNSSVLEEKHQSSETVYEEEEETKMIQAEDVKGTVHSEPQAIITDTKKKESGKHKKVWFLVCLLGITGVFFSIRPFAEDLYQKGIEYYENSLYAEAIPYFEKAAKKGNASAQFKLGVCYAYGEGVDKNPVKAVEWFRKAAEQGHAKAQFNLGVCYANGEGVDKNPGKAVEWYRKAAEQGDATAQYNLGVCYDNGKGVEKNLVKAVEWCRKAAEQGDASAQFNLGVCYDNGKGVEKDLVKAVEWYRKSAEQGNAEAQCNLGYCYEYGEGVEKDLVKAVEWYRKSAEQGNAVAQRNLGLMYEYGYGISQDYVKAFEWFSKAAEQGEELAKSNAMQLKKYMVVYGKNSMGRINKYEYVDIGLSVKWATRNIGANYPYDFGDYYSWGETSTKAKYGINYSNIKELSSMDISGSSIDVVHNKWGGTWRMPTKSEFIELKDKCDWEWFDENNIKGYIITGPNSNSIFLPAGDSKTEISYRDKNAGDYWSSTSNDDNSAFALLFGKEYLTEVRLLRFGYGLTIRPVSN